MRVLIATDGSPEATAAVRTAGRLLRKEENEFLILCVVPEFSGPKADEASNERVRISLTRRFIQMLLLPRARTISTEHFAYCTTA